MSPEYDIPAQLADRLRIGTCSFTVKAPNAITLTHSYAKQPKGSERHANEPKPHFLRVDLLNRFLETLAPLRGKLGPIMFQFEYLNKQKMPSLAAWGRKTAGRSRRERPRPHEPTPVLGRR